MRDVDAVALVYDYQGKKEHAADYLVQEAIRRGTSDNVTAMIVWF